MLVGSVFWRKNGRLMKWLLGWEIAVAVLRSFLSRKSSDLLSRKLEIYAPARSWQLF
jgi:hypothetical protein